jgi:transcriptional regulator with XRE-family HTH domain
MRMSLGRQRADGVDASIIEKATAEPASQAGSRQDAQLGAFGRQLRRLRQDRGFGVRQFARQAGLSPSMISRLEAGMVSPSLATIRMLSDALDVPITMLIQEDCASRTSTESEQAFQIIKRKFSGHKGKSDINFEPYLIEISDSYKKFSIFPQTGYIFIYLIRGDMEYMNGNITTVMSSGDHIFFEASIQHGVNRLIALPLTMLYVRVHPN